MYRLITGQHPPTLLTEENKTKQGAHYEGDCEGNPEPFHGGLMSPAELAVLGTLGGTLAGGLFSMIVAIVGKHSEERKQFRELVIRAAIENWKFVSEHAANKRIAPMTDYIVHMAKICDLVMSGKLTPHNARAELAKVNALMEIFDDNSEVISTRMREKARKEAEARATGR